MAGTGVTSTMVELVSTINSFVQKYVAPEIYDQVMTQAAVLYRFWKKGPQIDGGPALMWPIMFARRQYGGWYTGAMQLKHGAEDVITSAEVEWKHAYYDITIPFTDILKARSVYAKVDFIKSQFDSAILSLRAMLGEAIVGATTDTSPLRLNHLLEAVDAGGSALYDLDSKYQVAGFASYAGINNTEPYWKSYVMDKAGTASAALADFNQVYTEASDGSEHPTLVIVTPKGFNMIWSSLQANQRYLPDDEMGKVGFEAFRFNGATVVMDRNLPSGVALFINEKWVDLVSHEMDNFVVNPIQIGTQSERTLFTKIFWSGNLRVKIKKFQSKIVRATNL